MARRANTGKGIPTGLRAMSEHELAALIGRILAIGVGIAAGVVLAGGVLSLVATAGAAVDYSRFHPAPAALRHLSSIAREASRLSGPGLIQLGVVLLIATPVARVAFSAIAFLRQRDGLYVAITLTVLAALLFGLLGHAV